MTAPRVLIADDNPLNVELVSYVLLADGFEIATAADATETLAQVAAFAPDLILMDIQMPGTDGLELTRRLKATPATAHIIIAAFTAHAMRGDEEKMRAAGCDGYIAKPINVATVAATIRAYLAKLPGTA
jgi:two-component system, cell cycle response regulator DivK